MRHDRNLGPITPKLSRLIPRLATDADGEVLATVAAIRRVLAAEGLDLHDLAAALEPQPERVVYVDAEPGPWEPRTWAELARWIVENDDGRLREHERAFARDMSRRLVLRGEPMPRQGDWLRALYARLGGAE